MATKWTHEQQMVIDNRDRNLLVSAAAGSGKTAVLVERILQRVTDPVHPVDIDRMLIVTFTRAAAGEMKERIGKALEKRLEEEPENEHLQKQGVLLHHAQITTIDGFCTFVLQNYFHRIGIDPVYRIGEEGELRLLRAAVVEDLLEAEYAAAKAGDPERCMFKPFMDAYAPGRSDKGIEDVILKLHNFAMSDPYPEEWLERCVNNYRVGSVEELQQADWMQEVLQDTRLRLQDLIARAQALCEEAEAAEGCMPCLKVLEDDVQQYEKLRNLKTYTDFRDGLSVPQFARWSARISREDKAAYPTIPEQERIKGLREALNEKRKAIKAALDKLKEDFSESPEQIFEEMAVLQPYVAELVRLVRLFDASFSEAKRQKNLCDFQDLEHFALKILIEKDEEGNKRRTEAAKELASRFEEVMIDEYQDSNYLQEELLGAVSRNADGGWNRFMVGDMKQSIYGFRMARPELFLDKHDKYLNLTNETLGSKRNDNEVRIDLSSNFRSRAEVLNTANAVFSRLMIREVGGIVYDDAAALHPKADYPAPAEEGFSQSELLLLNRQDESFDDDRSKNRLLEIEARMIAGRIRELTRTGQVWDRDAGAYRPLRYKDCVILVRSTAGAADCYTKVLQEEGVPAYAASREGYFSTREVVTVLNMLRILDNPMQDIPYTSVLRSPIAGCTDEELAEIRIAYPNLPMYRAAEALASDPAKAGTALAEKLQNFLGIWQELRNEVPYTEVHVLVEEILEKTGFGMYAAAMPAGAQRSANLQMLVEKAVDYEKTSYHGLFNFIRYIELLEKYQVDYGEVNLFGEEDDTVRVMTIHKSKGLEFPVVFVSNLDKEFNRMDQKASIILHASMGIGIRRVDLERRTRKDTFYRRAVQKKMNLDMLSEELRVLYVALTRAKEKLILTGVVKKDKKLTEAIGRQGVQDIQAAKGGKIYEALPYGLIVGVKSYLEWILESLPGSELLKLQEMTANEFRAKEVQEASALLDRLQKLLVPEENAYAEHMRQIREEQSSFSYPYKKSAELPAKLTVSDIKHAYMEIQGEEKGQTPYIKEESVLAVEVEADSISDKAIENAGEPRKDTGIVSEGEEAVKHVSDAEVVELLPRFMREKEPEAATGAARGTVYHHFFECLDYSRIPAALVGSEEADVAGRSAADKRVSPGEFRQLCEILEAEKERMKVAGLLTAADETCMEIGDFARFLLSGPGRRMKAAADQGRLRREQPFVIDIAAKVIDSSWPEGENILVQGTIDAYFEENGRYVLVDYKTDRIQTSDGSDLVGKYEKQLQYYKYALERITGREVSEMWIYAVRLGRGIELREEV